MTDVVRKQRNSAELKTAAKQNLDGKWLTAIAVCFVAWLLVQAFTYSNGGNSTFRFVLENGSLVRVGNHEPSTFRNLASIVSFIIGGPIYFGVANYFLKLAKGLSAEFNDLFSGFSLFKTNFLLNFFLTLFTVLWSLLLVVPGIIAAIKYSMAYYIMNENPELSALEAIRLSKQMMDGHKMDFFVMWLSFLGWFILGIFTAGLGMLYAIPYYRAAKANFYLDLKANYSM